MQLKKTCKKCNKEFEPRRWEFELCPDCFRSQKNDSGAKTMDRKRHEQTYQKGHTKKQDDRSLPDTLKPQSLYDNDWNIKGEIYTEISTTLSEYFSTSRVNPSSIRPFFKKYELFMKNINVILMLG